MSENSSLDIFLDRQLFWKTRVIVDLSNIQHEDHIKQISSVMYDTSEMDEIREAAAVGLGKIATDSTIKKLEQALYDTSTELTSVFAVVGLSITIHPSANNILLEALQNEQLSARVRRSACYALGNRKVADVIPIAQQYIDEPFMIDKTFMGSNMAIETLLQFDSVDSSDVIVQWSINAMQNKNLDDIQREHAANYLARFANEDHVAVLETLLDLPIATAKRLNAGSSGNHILAALERIKRSN